MKLNEPDNVTIYGTGFYKNNIRTLYSRKFKGLLTSDYFKQLFMCMRSPTMKNVQELGDLKAIHFRVKGWIYKNIDVELKGDEIVVKAY